MSVVTTARDFAAAFATKFFKEGLPVAFATAIAAVVVGQYHRPIVVQAPAVAQPAPQPQPVQSENIVDLLKREPEIKPAALVPPKPAVTQEERRPRATAEKSDRAEKSDKVEKPVKHAAKPVEKPVERKPDPLPVVTMAPAPAPIAALPPAPPPLAALPLAPPQAAPPEPRVERAERAEWVGLLPLPTRVTGTVDRALDDAPVPPLPVPESRM